VSHKNPFPYPGGKVLTAPRIIDKFPAHECFVEVFGGAASVLCQKDPAMSTTEVYNDLNDDLVNYFEVARQDTKQLRDRLDQIPYARSYHDDVKERWYGSGDRPADPVDRAAEFVFLRCANINGIFGPSGFSAGRGGSTASAFRTVSDRVEWVAERFQNVVIESDDWEAIVDRYDGAETLFYFDPPYLNQSRRDIYGPDATEFDHEGFAERITDAAGYWIVSYSEVPPGLDRDEYVIEQWQKRWTAGTKEDEQTYGMESLIMNYEPSTEPPASVRTQDPREW